MISDFWIYFLLQGAVGIASGIILIIGLAVEIFSVVNRASYMVKQLRKRGKANKYLKFYIKHRIGYQSPGDKLRLLEAIINNKGLPAIERKYAATMLSSKQRELSQSK